MRPASGPAQGQIDESLRQLQIPTSPVRGPLGASTCATIIHLWFDPALQPTLFGRGTSSEACVVRHCKKGKRFENLVEYKVCNKIRLATYLTISFTVGSPCLVAACAYEVTYPNKAESTSNVSSLFPRAASYH